ncbi:MAG TPA: protein kinase [Acidobacteriota bacterium]|nr:protein kinase [Acidobacteriota bacterium]
MKCPKCSADTQSGSAFCARCGTSLAGGPPLAGETLLLPAQSLATGSTFAGRYQVIEELGEGGMGRVYKVLDREVGERIALKLLRPEVAARPDLIARFRDELRLARRISHKNVCRMFDLGVADGTTFITMELVDGEDLKKFIRRSGRLTVPKAVAIARQVGEGLSEAHRLGVVHRDLKPQNIMIDGEGNARIMDFGIARSVRAEGLTAAGAMIGTPEYMSPEQVEGRAADPRADIYALGVILFEMLAGRPPFEGDTALSVALKHKTDPPPDPRTLNPSIPGELAQVILKCLEKDREKRFGSAADLLGAFAGSEAEAGAQPSRRAAATAPPRTPPVASRSSDAPRRTRSVAAVALLVVAALSVPAYRLFRDLSKTGWAKGTALPEVMRLVDDGKLYEAFWLARDAERIIPRDKRLADLWPEMSREISVATEPPGGKVSIKAYDDVKGEWRELGTAPLSKARVPRAYLRWRIEKPGYKTVLWANAGPSGGLRVVLDRPEDLPPRMVRVPGGRHLPTGPLLLAMGPVEMADFLVDEFEVTNREFQEFVDKGGYADRRYWLNPFVKDGRTLTWEEGTAFFKDGTGRPGPSTWELGRFPEGRGDHPVGGISWFEAAAYAEFRGKSLPTVYHWVIAAGEGNASAIIPLSNFGDKGPAAVGSFDGLGPFGTRDTAGNVREWCWNASGGLRYSMGGAWNDPVYKTYEPNASDPFDRAAVNGFRCVKYLSAASCPALTAEPMALPYDRTFDGEKPVPDETFAIYRRLYSYDKKALNAVTEGVDDTSPFWRKEKITFDAAYGNERVTAYLYVPKSAPPPYQTVIYFPGDSALYLSSGADAAVNNFDYLVKDGRAVLYPVYKSTYERADGFRFEASVLTLNSWREHAVMWYKDFARSIDYLESRADVAADRLAYVGYSWGGHQGVILLGLETRIKAAIFLVGGFIPARLLQAVPEADHINFAVRIKIPVLMLNGKYDFVFPLNTAQEPLFRLLGTPAADKKYLQYETDHNLPRNEMIKETLSWLDKYLGPVRGPGPT